MAKDIWLLATFVENKQQIETCQVTSKQTIFLVFLIPVMYVERLPGQEMHLGCIRIEIVESNLFRIKIVWLCNCTSFDSITKIETSFTGPGMASDSIFVQTTNRIS